MFLFIGITKFNIAMEIRPVIIETERLFLRGYSPQDMTTLFDHYSKEEIQKRLGHRSEEEFEKEAYKQKNGYASYNRSFLLFLLEEKTSQTIFGRCGLHNWFAEHRRAEIGYHITIEDYKRKGFMTEAVNAVIDYGFTELKLHRIEALVGSTNIPSLKIMEQHHFVREGLLRQHYYNNGSYEDSVVFSKLASEYFTSGD